MQGLKPFYDSSAKRKGKMNFNTDNGLSGVNVRVSLALTQKNCW